jgi:anaerobic selenocysteine-containing dehydrogenase
MGIVHASRGSLTPASKHLLSEPSIVANLATATLKNSNTNWNHFIEDYDRIREAIQNTIPGFDDYNRRIRNDGGFYLPNGARDGDFKTKTGKANFTNNPVPKHELKEGEFTMMTIRTHDQFNTTIYGLDDRYRGIYNGRRIVMMNIEDIKDANLKAGDFIDLYNHHEGVERIAPHFMIVEYDIPQKCMATYFPEANILVPINQYAHKSKTPASKQVLVTFKRNQV